MAAVETKDRPRVRAFPAARLVQAAPNRMIWRHVPEIDIPFNSVLDPNYWANATGKGLSRGDMIEIEPEDESYFAILKVLKVERGWAQVVPVVFCNIAQALDAIGRDLPPAMPYKVKWAGQHKKYQVYNDETKAAVKDGFASEDAAQKWARDHWATVRRT